MSGEIVLIYTVIGVLTMIRAYIDNSICFTYLGKTNVIRKNRCLYFSNTYEYWYDYLAFFPCVFLWPAFFITVISGYLNRNEPEE